MIEFRVRGLPELKAALLAIPDKLRKRALLSALRSAGSVVRKEARRVAPILSPRTRMASGLYQRIMPYRRPGTLRKAISVRTSKIARRAGDVGVFINVRPAKNGQRGAKSPVDPYYWRWINFGWKFRPGGWHFLEAGGKMLPQALQIFTQKIGPAIGKLNNKGQTP